MQCMPAIINMSMFYILILRSGCLGNQRYNNMSIHILQFNVISNVFLCLFFNFTGI